jgi:hypothetical protein
VRDPRHAFSDREIPGAVADHQSQGQALIHTALGDFDAGRAALARAVTDHSGLVNGMRTEPWLDPLRGRACFAEAGKALRKRP